LGPFAGDADQRSSARPESVISHVRSGEVTNGAQRTIGENKCGLSVLGVMSLPNARDQFLEQEKAYWVNPKDTKTLL
jgi:hypothetical protein